jgi:phage-related minor tail protein
MNSQNSTTNQQDGEDHIRATYAGAKRRIAALEEQLQNLRDAGVKRKSRVPVLCIC